MVWQRPERLLPPQLVEALEAVHAGDVPRALRLVATSAADDPLTADAVRLVRGLAAAETGEGERAHVLLRPLMTARDGTMALAATLASVELRMQQRSFASAAPWLRRARRQAADEPTALVLDAALLRLQLRRAGAVASDDLVQLQQRLRRRHAAAVHATVFLLACECALYAGQLEAATRAERTAHPYVASAENASLRRWHTVLVGLLQGAPVALVEDWQRPLRAMCRAELADLEREPWQLWVDLRQRKLAARSTARAPLHVVHFAAQPQLWEAWRLLLTAPERRLTWPLLQRGLGSADAAAAREQARLLAAHLAAQAIGAVLRLGATGCSLVTRRFVHLHPPQDLHPVQQQLLAHLAALPGARGQELVRALRAPQRTVQRHLHALRLQGLVVIVGGGREARYWAI